jgi:uncharacterized protein RhaS with RHS repeats
MYDSTTGRFLSVDPLGLEPDTNRYRYVRNNPANLVDPFGLDAIVITNPESIAGLEGHTAVLVQDANGKWVYYSWQGPGGSSPSPSPGGNQGGQRGIVKVACTDLQDAKSKADQWGYKWWIRYHTTKDQDKKIIEFLEKNYDKNAKYDVRSNNCAQAIWRALKEAGIPIEFSDEDHLPKRIHRENALTPLDDDKGDDLSNFPQF